jgi:hypothetical protein
MYVHIHAAFPCLCGMSISILHDNIHAARPRYRILKLSLCRGLSRYRFYCKSYRSEDMT